MEENITQLSDSDILAILRAADEIIGQGGRTLLVKILKGSREKKVLELELDKCPVYGHFNSESKDEVLSKVNWMIDSDFLDIQYSGKLPMIFFTDRGWRLESNQRADEFLSEWDQWLAEGRQYPDMNYLKDRNREMILLFLEKIKETGDRKYIPYLEAWRKIDYKKVKAQIRDTIEALKSDDEIDLQTIQKRNGYNKELLKGSAPKDLLIKCWKCGERFTFTIGEQKFYKERDLSQPNRCEDCRMNATYGDFI